MASAARLEVGFNYPWAWNKYGLYFGGGSPPGSDPHLDAWHVSLKTNLTYLRDTLGISKVRIFLFCNAITLGTTSWNARRGEWNYEPPARVHPKFVEHLERMCSIFRDAEMQVLPVLLDFGAFLSKRDWPSRQQIATDIAKRKQFLDTVLTPFLKVSSRFRNSIYAWEIMNEPYWASRRWPRKTNDPVRASVLKSFLSDAVRRIDAYREPGVDGPVFQSTIGHRFLDDLASWPTGTIRQFHYYPYMSRLRLPGSPGGLRRVLQWPTLLDPILRHKNRLPSFARSQAILGEIGTNEWDTPFGDDWPEIPRRKQRHGAARVEERLRLVESKGYGLAFLWPSHGVPAPAPGPSDPLKLSPEVQRGVLRFQLARRSA